jgi:hypothetical protein
MNNKIIWLIIFVAIIVGFIIFWKAPEEQIDPQKIAEDWIVNNSSTYKFDGENLTFLNKENDKMYFAFQSTSSGYGDRSSQVLATVITPHIIEIIIEDNEIKSAVTDGRYDELNNTIINVVPEDKEVSIYFLNISSEQEQLVEKKRIIHREEGISYALSTLNELLNGPTEEEAESGIFSMINPGTVVYDLIIIDGIARVDFNEKLQEGVAGSATVIAIRNQIEKTLLQFNDISKVIISINGNSEEILQP